MGKNDNVKFGEFLAILRKEKGYTQKELAEKLFISDKAISKWERGLSMPDISLLIPLSEILEVTATELLKGEKIQQNTNFSSLEVEQIMKDTLALSEKEIKIKVDTRKNRKIIYFCGIIILALEFILMVAVGYSFNTISEDIGIVIFLMLIFSTYFTFFVKENLPSYYDQNKISFYSDGIFRMNMAGVKFNNSNWPHIVNYVHISMVSIMAIFPFVYLMLDYNFPLFWVEIKLVLTLSAVFAIFIPIYIAGKKYE